MANLATKDFFEQKAVKSKFEELMGKKSQQFITSILQVTASNSLLTKATPESIYGAAITAAVLDLPIQNNLGFAYIVPYGGQAQFQIGYKGLIQLAIRTGQFKNISACPIYAGQIVSENPLTGYVFDFSVKKQGEPIGYAAYIAFGAFEKIEYLSKEDALAHGKKFSKQFSGVWTSNFDAMALKTVMKMVLKFAPLSVEIQRAVVADQSVSNDGENYSYPDNGMEHENKSDKASKLFGEILDVKSEDIEPVILDDTEAEKQEALINEKINNNSK